jgi:hypothetical protein
MAMRTSRAPVIPLRDPDKSVTGELFIKDTEAMPHLYYKDEKLTLVDIIAACVDPMFNKLDEDFRNKHVDAIISNHKPTGGQSIWYGTELFEQALTDDDQL